MKAARIFDVRPGEDFDELALEVFRYQFRHNPVYQEFCKYLGKTTSSVVKPAGIPYLPIQFFKSHRVVTGKRPYKLQFRSSGTTGAIASSHYLTDPEIYRQSFTRGFELFYGPARNFCILALLPSYLERKDASLVYMVQDLIKQSQHPYSGFYLRNTEELVNRLQELEAQKNPILLIGVSFALLDMAEQFPMQLKHTILMETGGMKGRRKELIREELHKRLKKGFGVREVHSEYGMTELLSQAYSKGKGIFRTAPWMRVNIRDYEDPMTLNPPGRTGGINVIDLANLNSCSFIATQDLGKIHEDGSFEVLGRFDHSDIRGCNLMAL